MEFLIGFGVIFVVYLIIGMVINSRLNKYREIEYEFHDTDVYEKDTEGRVVKDSNGHPIIKHHKGTLVVDSNGLPKRILKTSADMKDIYFWEKASNYYWCYCGLAYLTIISLGWLALI